MTYKTVKQGISVEFVERKSRFIAHVRPVTQEQQALDMINALKSKFWDASHNVYAYALRESNIQRYSDDGEPSGTAGVPVLEVLKKEHLTDVCVVVTRYFGGTLLGTGGLVRAYTHSAKLGIENAGRVTMQFGAVFEVNVTYDMLGRVQNAVLENGGVIKSTEYKEDVVLSVFVPDYINLTDTLINAANGRIIITKHENEYLQV